MSLPSIMSDCKGFIAGKDKIGINQALIEKTNNHEMNREKGVQPTKILLENFLFISNLYPSVVALLILTSNGSPSASVMDFVHNCKKWIEIKA